LVVVIFVFAGNGHQWCIGTRMAQNSVQVEILPTGTVFWLKCVKIFDYLYLYLFHTAAVFRLF